MLDCEDGVALNRKSEARHNIYNLYSTDERVRDSSKYAVRINGPQTTLAREDIQAVVTSTKPVTLFVPKTNSADDIKWLYDSVNTQLQKHLSETSNRTQMGFYFYMETATSLVNLREIITTALQLSSSKYNSMFKLGKYTWILNRTEIIINNELFAEGFVFGSDDFCADIGAERTYEASELAFARQKLIAYCKAFKLKAIDMVYIDFKGNQFLFNSWKPYFNIEFE